MPIVHGAPQSPFVRKVLVALEEKGIPYELEPLVPFPKTPALLARSPLGKIPILEDGDFVTRDSSVICAYLERKHPKGALYPADLRDFARALWYEEYADTRLFEVLIVPFVERYVRPNVFGEAGDEERVRRTLAEDLPQVLGYLEGELGDGDGIVGGRFSIADVALGAQLATFCLSGETIDAARWPRVARYVERILARPSFARAIAPAMEAA